MVEPTSYLTRASVIQKATMVAAEVGNEGVGGAPMVAVEVNTDGVVGSPIVVV